MERERWIKNFDELAVTEGRRLVLEIAEAGYEAIGTEKVVEKNIKLENDTLLVQGEAFDLAKFKKIKVIGFGKCSSVAARALEKILGDKICEGIAISPKRISCRQIQTFIGSHPKPSSANVAVGKKIYRMIQNSKEDELIIVIVSGGGSALLCVSEEECEQEIRFYDEIIKYKETISRINTVRKHFPSLKGGELAKLAYPATVLGLIFSDVPGDHFAEVASGPTYRDETTLKAAQAIVEEHKLGNFKLVETPKEEKYFEKVRNFILVSNQIAVSAMKTKAEEFCLNAQIISTELYDEVKEAAKKIFSVKEENKIILAAGEPELEITKKGGFGGRNTHLGLTAVSLGLVGENDIFLTLASDGIDNSEAAGALIDEKTLENIDKFKIDINKALADFNSYPTLQKAQGLIITGPTGSNVSDLMLLLTKK
jgi:glycerate-2-kinase